MCLSDLGHVVAVDDARRTAQVDIRGRVVEVSTVALGLDVPTVEEGAWLVIHTGLAVERLSDHDAQRITRERATFVTAEHRSTERLERRDRPGREEQP